MSQPFIFTASNDSSTGNSSLSVTFLDDARVFNFGPQHPSLNEATTTVVGAFAEFNADGGDVADADKVAALKETLTNLQRIRAAIGTKLREVCDDVSYDGNHIYFQGEALESNLGKFLLDLLREEDPQWKAVGKFLQKVMQNPSKASRDSLFDWLRDRELTITTNGDFIAYKGVAIDENGISVSVRSGPGIVDGVVMDGHLPNRQGSVLEMPRADVNSDSNVGCSVGLHAGTYDYAKGWARGRVVKVQINPAHVVSVPKDCSFQKLRVWKYLVLEETEAPETLCVVADYNTDEDGYGESDDDSFFCEHCSRSLDEDEIATDEDDDELLCSWCLGDREDAEAEDEDDEDDLDEEGMDLSLLADTLRDALHAGHTAQDESESDGEGDGESDDATDDSDDEDGSQIRIVITG